MGFFSRLGNKISHAYDKASRFGMKALGTASRIGHKVSDVGHGIVSAVEKSPLSMIPFVAGATGIANKVLQGVDKGTALADKTLGVMGQVDDVVRSARSSLEKPATAPVDAGLQKHSAGSSGGSLRESGPLAFAPDNKRSKGRG